MSSNDSMPDSSATFRFRRIDPSRLKPTVCIPKQAGATVQIRRYGNDPRDVYVLTRFKKRNSRSRNGWSYNKATASKVKRGPTFTVSTVGR